MLHSTRVYFIAKKAEAKAPAVKLCDEYQMIRISTFHSKLIGFGQFQWPF